MSDRITEIWERADNAHKMLKEIDPKQHVCGLCSAYPLDVNFLMGRIAHLEKACEEYRKTAVAAMAGDLWSDAQKKQMRDDIGDVAIHGRGEVRTPKPKQLANLEIGDQLLWKGEVCTVVVIDCSSMPFMCWLETGNKGVPRKRITVAEATYAKLSGQRDLEARAAQEPLLPTPPPTPPLGQVIHLTSNQCAACKADPKAWGAAEVELVTCQDCLALELLSGDGPRCVAALKKLPPGYRVSMKANAAGSWEPCARGEEQAAQSAAGLLECIEAAATGRYTSDRPVRNDPDEDNDDNQADINHPKVVHVKGPNGRALCNPDLAEEHIVNDNGLANCEECAINQRYIAKHSVANLVRPVGEFDYQLTRPKGDCTCRAMANTRDVKHMAGCPWASA